MHRNVKSFQVTEAGSHSQGLIGLGEEREEVEACDGHWKCTRNKEFQKPRELTVPLHS